MEVRQARGKKTKSTIETTEEGVHRLYILVHNASKKEKEQNPEQNRPTQMGKPASSKKSVKSESRQQNDKEQGTLLDLFCGRKHQRRKDEKHKKTRKGENREKNIQSEDVRKQSSGEHL